MSNVIDFNDFAACFKSYVPYVKSRVLVYCENNNEFDDYFQEGLLGLFEAAKAFDESKEVKFLTFAKVCIDNKLKNLKRKSSGKQQVPNTSISGLDDIASVVSNETPENIVIDKDEIDFLKQKAKLNLSKMEYKVFCFYICGYSYLEIAQKMQISEKSVDNAIQRIKNKLN